jgi:uncharacterized protein (TIGR02246 family)
MNFVRIGRGREDEAAIRQLVRKMHDAQNTRDGELFASAFAHEHDYIAINGMFLANRGSVIIHQAALRKDFSPRLMSKFRSWR